MNLDRKRWMPWELEIHLVIIIQVFYCNLCYILIYIFINNLYISYINNVENEICKQYEMEKDNVGEIFIIISDVQLDKPLVIEKLQTLFQGFEDQDDVNPLFILMGSFITKPMNTSGGREAIRYLSIYLAIKHIIYI